MTADEHLAWAKKRALEYLDKGDVRNAITSIMSDLQKHPDTALHEGSILTALGLKAAISNDIEEARRYIVGFR